MDPKKIHNVIIHSYTPISIASAMAQTWSPHSMLDSTWGKVNNDTHPGCFSETLSSPFTESYTIHIYLGYHGSTEPPSVHHRAVAGVQDGPDLGVGLLVTAHPDGHLTCSAVITITFSLWHYHHRFWPCLSASSPPVMGHSRRLLETFSNSVVKT